MRIGRSVGRTCLAVLTACIGNAVAFAPAPAQVQRAFIAEDFGYINTDRGGGPGGDGVDGDDAPALQPASMTATFSNFILNGISFADWRDCRAAQSVDECLELLVADANGDGVISLQELHPGKIGGDVLTFDITITNTSPSDGPVLTSFAFQSKFSESPALGSRIGDKLFSGERVGDVIILEGDGLNPLIGVKKNGTANGLFFGKIKGICINSSDDYPSDLNLGVENETLECAGGRTFDRSINRPVLQAADGSFIDANNIDLPKGLLPGESMTMTLELDSGTDDGALQRAFGGDEPNGDTGPLVGTLANLGVVVAPDQAATCLELDVQAGDNVLEVVNFGDVKIVRNAAGECFPSFEPFSKNQFLTIPRRNWGFTDILDTRDDFLPEENPTPGQTGKFSFLDFDNLTAGELNFFEILRGFGEHGETLDPSCEPGGSQEGKCGGSPYVPWAEFYALADGHLVRQEVEGTYGSADYSGEPTLTATIDTGDQTSCEGPDLAVNCKTTDPFEVAGQPDPGSMIGATADATFWDVTVVSDDKTTIENEGGRAAGDLVQVTLEITNTSPAGSDIYLTSFNFQSKRRGLTDINELDGTSIQGRQDLRLGADGTLEVCGDDPLQAQCFDEDLGIGRFPNVLGNSLLSATEVFGLDVNKLGAIKKNGTFQPLEKADDAAANFICIKSGAPAEDQDADETCSGEPTDADGNPLGLAPGESQTVRIELDYGDFRGLILRVTPGTMVDYVSPDDDPFGLLALGGDFDCRDQRRLPYCHPDLLDDGDWFTSPTTLTDVEFVTVHQAGDAPSVMDFTSNFGILLAMAGFVPTAEFWQGSTQMQVRGAYEFLPGGHTTPPPDGDDTTNEAPVASFTHSCIDLDCEFDAIGSTDDGTITTYDWDFGDGATAEGVLVSHTYAAAGTYTVTLTVTDDQDASDSTSEDITVQSSTDDGGDSGDGSDGGDGGDDGDSGDGDGAAFTIDGCTNFVCYFDASAVSDATAYNWDFGDGTTGSGVMVSRLYGTDPVPEGFEETFSVTLTVTHSDGSMSSAVQDALVRNLSGADPLFDMGNIHPNGRNVATNDAQTVTWTSAFTDNDYTVNNTVRVHVRWSVDMGATGFTGVRPRGDGFSPNGVEGTAPRVVASGADYTVFEFEFTEIPQRGNNPEAKGNAQFWVDIETDQNGDGILDGEAALGVNVHVIEQL